MAFGKPQVSNFEVNPGITAFHGNQWSRVDKVRVTFDCRIFIDDPSAFALVLHTDQVYYDGVAYPQGYGNICDVTIRNVPVNPPDFAYGVWAYDIRFTGGEAGADGYYSIPDGVYAIVIDCTKVKNAQNVAGEGTARRVFARQFGERGGPAAVHIATHTEFDLVVDGADDTYGFRPAFNGTYAAEYDWNGDGVVNSYDNLKFLENKQAHDGTNGRRMQWTVYD